MTIKALIWKDMCVIRWVLVAGGVLLALPFLILFIGALVSPSKDWWTLEPLSVTVGMSLLLSMVTFALLGGYAFAAERADRSADFLAYIPASRLATVTSKAVVSISASLILLVIHRLLFRAFAPADTSAAESLYYSFFTAILMLGVAWLCSTATSSPTLASGSGIFAPILGVITIHSAHRAFDLPMESYGQHYIIFCLVGGCLSFMLGSAYYLRRFMP